MTQAEWVAELVAQVEAHGAESVRFYTTNAFNDEEIEIEMFDAKYENGVVKVRLE